MTKILKHVTVWTLTLILFAGCTQKIDTNQSSPPNVPELPSASEGLVDTLALYDATTPDSEVETALVARYYGSLDITDAPLFSYDISMVYHKPHAAEENEKTFEIHLRFYEFNSNTLVQELIYTAEKCLWPESVDQGLLVEDVNGDGNDDILMDLGIMGQMRHAVCFVYAPDNAQYVVVPGFDELNTPIYNPTRMVFDVEGNKHLVDEDGYGFGMEQYRIEGRSLVLTDRLLAKYVGEGEGWRYKAEQRSGDEMELIQNGVTSEELDQTIWDMNKIQ